jgi:TRAP-type C4-dicarboxylate transport system substrate-binding protein
VRSLEDLKGLKLRAPSAIGAAALEAWGVNPVTLPVTELYNALQTGVVDGVMISADGVASFRLHEVAKFATTNLPASYTTFYLVANRDSWESIPAETRSAVEPLFGKQLSERAATAYQPAAVRALELMSEPGIEIVELSPEEKQKLDSGVQPVIEDYVVQLEAQGIDGQAILSAIKNWVFRPGV